MGRQIDITGQRFGRLIAIRDIGSRPISRTPEYRAAIRKRRRENATIALSERLSRLMAWSLISVGAIKTSPTFKMLGFTPTELKIHIEKQFVEGMSWMNRNEWHLDHIIPIKLAKTIEDVVALNQLSNLRPLWKKQNLEKQGNRSHLL